MKILFGVIILIAGFLFVSAYIKVPETVTALAVPATPIPDAVIKVMERSCVNCHSVPGNKLALYHFNITNWDKYSPRKQAVKAKTVCKMVRNGKMPPKRFREVHPEGVPPDEDIKTICDWADSLQAVKK